MMVVTIERVARHDGTVPRGRARQHLRDDTARGHQHRKNHQQQEPNRFHLGSLWVGAYARRLSGGKGTIVPRRAPHAAAKDF
jgi:hypothetical protein